MRNLSDTQKNLYVPFLWMGFSCLKATEPQRGEYWLFTNKSSGVTSTRLIYLRRVKGQYILSYFFKPLGLYTFPEIFPNFLITRKWIFD